MFFHALGRRRFLALLQYGGGDQHRRFPVVFIGLAGQDFAGDPFGVGSTSGLQQQLPSPEGSLLFPGDVR